MSKVGKNTNAKTPLFTSSHKKHLDNLKLFLSRPDVKQRIAEVRHFLGLPSGGFSDEKNQAEYIQNWNSTMSKRSDTAKTERTKMIKEKVQAGELSQSMAQKQKDLLFGNLPENYLTDKVNSMIKEYHLPLDYDDSLRTYIISGIIHAPPLPFSIVSYGKDPVVRLFETVTVEFRSKLTDDDLQSLKRLVNDGFFGKQLPESPEAIKDVDIKFKIEEEQENKKWFDASEQKMRKNNAKDIAEKLSDEHGVIVTANNIYDNPREMKRLRGRFDKKSGK